MKRTIVILVLCLPVLFQIGCKPDPKNKVTFKVDGINFILNTLDGITVATHLASHQVGSSVFDKTIVTLRGRSQTRLAVIEFVLFHQQGEALSDVYLIVNRQTDFDNYLADNIRACHGLMSSASITDINSGVVLKNGLDPMGFVQLVKKENDVFLINFDGFFTIFNDDLIIGQFTAIVHVESKALVQVFN
jgi:uncharacterized RmlC-like cupin family protein